MALEIMPSERKEDAYTYCSNWESIRLGDVCLKADSVNPTNHPEDTFTYIDVSSVSNESYSVTEASRILGKNAPSRARKRILAGDVIIATVRPTLRRIALIPPELDSEVCSTGYCVVRANPNRLEPEFAYYFLLSNKVFYQVEALQKGATYPAISDVDVYNLPLLLPSLPEQQAIAHVLSIVQDAIQTRRRELVLERERKAVLMQHLFTYGTRGAPTKQTEIGEMPESWQVVKLRELAEVAYGLTVNKQRRHLEEVVPYLTVANLTRGRIHLDNIKYIGVSKGDLERYRLQKDDILLIEGNGNPSLLGSAAIWNDELPLMLHQNHLIRVRFINRECFSQWLMYYLNGDLGKKQILGRAKTSD